MASIQSISSSDVDPVTFFQKYISTRTPVKFTNQFEGAQWRFHKWSNEYLKNKAGGAQVKIEFRDSSSGRYGKGNDQIFEFKDFLSEMESGNEKLYMTTQKLHYSPEGQPSIISEPVKGLLGDFPIRPDVMGNLIVQNINMWMGCSSEPSTSGLHHDFHDNIYIVLRGTKKINLFPPEEFPNMYLVGSVTKLHPNGRFNYEGKAPTNADGSCIGSIDAIVAANKLEQAALKCDCNDGDSEAEEEIESALEALLDAQMAEGETVDDYEDDGCDDYNDDDEEEEEEEEDGSVGDLSEEQEGVEEGVVSDGREVSRGLKRILGVAAADDCRLSVSSSSSYQAAPPAKRQATSRHSTMAATASEEENEEASLAVGEGDPPSFSRVDTSLPEDTLRAEFPLFVEARDRCMISVEVNAGEMLYLPAGWFHEVRSVGPPPLGHLAFNYWFHPPDGQSVEKPYLSDFWTLDWNSRKSIV